MGHTNSTTNYGLPQFITTDKPAWLTDINGAFTAIDTAVDNAQDAANAAQNDATQALTDAGTAITAASTADAKGAGAIASIADTFDPTTIYAVGDKVFYNNLLYICTTAVVTPGPWTGSTNWDRITIETMINGLNGSTIESTSTPGSPSIATKLSTIETALNGKVSQVKFENIPVTISAASGYFEFTSILYYPTANSILIGCDIRTQSLYATSGTIIQCCYAPSGAKPAFQYQRGASAFSNVNYDFVFTFFEPAN